VRKPPQTDIDAAKAAFSAAQTAEAELYAADAYAAARSAVDKMDAEVAAQARKGALSAGMTRRRRSP